MCGGMGYLSERYESNESFVFVENVSELRVQLMKNGSTNKSDSFIFLLSVSAKRSFFISGEAMK